MLRNPDCLRPKTENLFFPPKKGDYQYFETAPPAKETSLPARAAWAADGAMLAYARYGPQRMQEDEFIGILRGAGYQSVETIGDCFGDRAHTARAFFASNDRHALLAFRGTEKDNPHDIEADADTLLVDGPVGRVHQGFYHYFQSVLWRVAQVVRNYRIEHPTQEICITGHSLGAALATLTCAVLKDPKAALFTFGCPRVGDVAFCDAIARLAESNGCYRVVNNDDVVTHIPLHVAGLDYQHPNVKLLWLDPQGALQENPANPPSDWSDVAHLAFGFVNGHLLEFLPTDLPRPLADHSPVRYCHWMAQAA